MNLRCDLFAPMQLNGCYRTSDVNCRPYLMVGSETFHFVYAGRYSCMTHCGFDLSRFELHHPVCALLV